MPGSNKRVRARPLTAFLASTEEPKVKAQAKPEVEVGAKAQVESKVQTETWTCEELIKDRRKLVRAIARYLIKYSSVGSIRLAIDLLPCAGNPVDAFLKYLKPVLLVLEKMGFIELVRGDPEVGVMVVNLNLPNLIAQARGDSNGSGQ